MDEPLSLFAAWCELSEGPLGLVRSLAATAFVRAKQDAKAALRLLPVIVAELAEYERDTLAFLDDGEVTRIAHAEIRHLDRLMNSPAARRANAALLAETTQFQKIFFGSHLRVVEPPPAGRDDAL